MRIWEILGGGRKSGKRVVKYGKRVVKSGKMWLKSCKKIGKNSGFWPPEFAGRVVKWAEYVRLGPHRGWRQGVCI